MLYLGTSPSEPQVADLLDRRRIGLMCQPGSNLPRAGWLWAGDNACHKPECFLHGCAVADCSGKWDESRWLRWLARPDTRSGCLFQTVPDVVGDARATLDRWHRYRPRVLEARYPLAYVAQDGFDPTEVPWDELDALFVGGTNAFKDGAAYEAAVEARARGKHVHVGRVNTQGRYLAWAGHADSADGTFLAWSPSGNLPRLTRWLGLHDDRPQLWEADR